MNSNPEVIPGTRLLWENFGLVGESFRYHGRTWRILSFYLPVNRLGVRARVVDEKGFHSFINQRDLEVLLGAEPNTKCKWLGEEYPVPGVGDWYGMCVDSIDLEDDLYERELQIRDTMGDPLPPLSIERRIHNDGTDWERTELLLWDKSPTGECPDRSLDTIRTRWSTAERRKIEWDEV